MNLPKNYNAEEFENQIYQRWETENCFSPSQEGEPFSIMMPPPNATGNLHLGHAIMLAIQDIIIRQKRMQGYSTLWVPGTDHASIATQNRVEKNLNEKGITREQLGRKGLLQEIETFVDHSKDTIRNQIRKMGSSCDWSREKFTFSPELNKVVTEVFCKMYQDGLIYRGNRIVNWCTRCGSTLADDEVTYKENKGKFYYIKYGPFIIGTARPETKFQDKYVIVNPKDTRYKEYIGQTLTIDWINGPIEAKVIADEIVDPEFGSGAMTITPAHSFEDFNLAKKYDLPIELIIDEKGQMTELAGKYKGMPVKECREKLVEEMQEKGLIHEIDENYVNNLSVCYRCSTAIEPLISKQWFISVDKAVVDWNGKKMSLKEIALEVVKTKEVEIIPSEFEKIYFNWMENLHDWCISRQIWYGHQIPVWYNGDQVKVQAESPGAEWTLDDDTLDTWFSSGMWTFSGLGWPNNLDDFNKFHPTSVLETGHDILFFWVARMILMTTYATKQVPFKKVYLHGLIRDRNGKKMSKSLGNGIDPLDMIAKYGTDALRLSLVIGNTAGRDLKIYEEKIESFRNFITKLWNGSRFTFMNLSKIEYVSQIDLNKVTALHDKWILTRLQEVIEKVTTQLDKYSISEAGTTIYEFLWDEFCDWYLEFSKESKNEQVLSYILQNILILLHPFIPFVTENIWTNFTGTKNQLILEKWPISNPDYKFQESNQLNTIIKLIRHIRTEKSTFGLAAKKDLTITVLSQNKLNSLVENKKLILKLSKLANIEFSSDLDLKVNQASLTMIESDLKLYLHLEGQIDFKAEADKTSQEIESTLKLIGGFEARLSNESYVKNAPKEIVEETQNNLQESKNRLLELEKRLQVLNI